MASPSSVKFENGYTYTEIEEMVRSGIVPLMMLALSESDRPFKTMSKIQQHAWTVHGEGELDKGDDTDEKDWQDETDSENTEVENEQEAPAESEVPDIHTALREMEELFEPIEADTIKWEEGVLQSIANLEFWKEDENRWRVAAKTRGVTEYPCKEQRQRLLEQIKVTMTTNLESIERLKHSGSEYIRARMKKRLEHIEGKINRSLRTIEEMMNDKFEDFEENRQTQTDLLADMEAARKLMGFYEEKMAGLKKTERICWVIFVLSGSLLVAIVFFGLPVVREAVAAYSRGGRT